MSEGARVDQTRDQRRSRRKREVRGRTISIKRLSLVEREAARAACPDTDHDRPRTRGDCADVPRPCPYVGCKWNLYLDVSDQTGSIKLNFPDISPWEMPADASCALDVADRGGATLEEVGALINVTRERVRQIEVMALAHLAEQREEFAEFADSASDQQPARGKRSLPTVYLRRGSRADVIEAVRSGAKTIRDVAFLVYGSGDLPAYHRAARLLSSLVREGTLVRNRGYRIAGGVHG